MDCRLTLIVTQIAKLQLSDSEHSELKWAEGFNIGTVIEGKIHDAKDFGVVISFEKYNDVFGFITHYQCMFSYSKPSLFIDQLLHFSQ